MKFELNEYHRNISDNELIDDLKYVANLINKNTVTLDEYNEYGHFHCTTLTRRFGSWFKCLELANLAPSRSIIGISNEELFEELENVWVQLGKQPSYAQMRDIARFQLVHTKNVLVDGEMLSTHLLIISMVTITQPIFQITHLKITLKKIMYTKHLVQSILECDFWC